MAENSVECELSLRDEVARKIFEIERQMRQRNGYPFDLQKLNETLQRISEGQFAELSFFNHVRLDWNRVYVLLELEDEYRQFEDRNSHLLLHKDYWWIPVLRGVDLGRVVRALGRLHCGLSFSGIHPSTDFLIDDRSSAESDYCVSLHKRIEARSPSIPQSAFERRVKKKTDITFHERLLLELAFLVTTNHHLDNEGSTLCTGSRVRQERDGVNYVPGIGWRLVSEARVDNTSRELQIHFYHPEFKSENLGLREVMVMQLN